MKFKQCNVVVSEPLDDTALNWVFRLNVDSKFVTESFFYLNSFQKNRNPPKPAKKPSKNNPPSPTFSEKASPKNPPH
jgi:hypothetical protein